MTPAALLSSLYEQLDSQQLTELSIVLRERVNARVSTERDGNLARWQAAIDNVPPPTEPSIHYSDGLLQLGAESCATADASGLTAALRELHPWRKGPLRIGGVGIDTEWRSDWKWDRVERHLAPLEGRSVLDVGCGNGYHCWRMLLAGAREVIGVDPTVLFMMQFMISKQYAGDLPVWLVPLGIEEFPSDWPRFDTVFSMGVLYHRRSPIDHLIDLRERLRPGGELVLETLVVDGPPGYALMPPGRYAQMRNVWFLPSTDTLNRWLERCGFDNVRTVDVTVTSTDEQRRTDWMQFQSLADFLDPDNPALTREGHPAPTRAIVLATHK